MIDCIICGHGLHEHQGNGCQHHGLVRSHCGCSYVQLPPLPPAAGVAEHRARSDWWDRQARIVWDLASASREDLDRWYPLMRFHRAARRAELDHRRYADSLMAPARQREEQPWPVPVAEDPTVPGHALQPLYSLASRLEPSRLT